MENLERRTSPSVTPPPPIGARSPGGVALGQPPAVAEAALFNEMAETLVLAGLMDAEVRQALAGIPEVFRACLILADLEGFSYQEIAEILGIPRGTVMSRLFRGRRAMRRQLVQYGRDHGYAKAG